MSRQLSIAISAKDNFSSAIATMRNANQHFNKDLDGLQQKLNAINATKTTLSLDTKAAKKSLEALQKEYLAAKKSGDSMVSDELIKRLQDANDEYETARRNLDLVSRSAKDAEKSMVNYSSESSKAGNKAAGAKDGMMSALAAAGALKMGGDMLSGIASAWVSSYGGSAASTMFSSILGGAASGAAIGTAINPGMGTAVGAAIGTGVGVVNGLTQNYANEDEAFKTVKNQLIDEQNARLQSDISAGSGISAQRQMDAIAFTKLIGDKETAETYLEWVKDTANSTPLLYDDLKTMSKTLATYGYSPEEMQQRLIQIGDTGSALGMNTQDMSMVATGLGRMKSSGKTTLEYLNLLVERGIPAIDYLAEAMGATNAEVYDMVSRGLIPGAKAADAIADAMGKANSGAMAEMAETFSGMSSTVAGLKQEVEAAAGEGYNKEREKSLRAEIYHLSGENGERAKEANNAIGAYYASLENKKDSLRRRAEKKAYAEIDKLGLDREGAEAGKILMEARAKAAAEYNASEGAQNELKMQEQLIGDVTSMLVKDKTYWNAGYLLAQEQSKGMAAGLKDNTLTLQKEAAASLENMAERDIKGKLTEEEVKIVYPGTTFEGYKKLRADSAADGYAYGLNYVPYNNFPALLHEGEQVLTASEARSQREAAPVTITGNNFVVREEADIYKIAQEIARELGNATMLS